MSNAELRNWIATFDDAAAELANYEVTLANVARRDPNAARRTGSGQLVAFQLPVILPRLGTAAARYANGNVPLDSSEFSDATLLGLHYFLSATEIAGTEPPLEEARETLNALALRLRDMATKWAESGVDAEEKATLAAETSALADRLKVLAAQRNG